jgi:L-lactate dehydrogenase complex protein LldF
MTPASSTSPRCSMTGRPVDNVETGKPARRRETDDRRDEGLPSGVEGFNDRARKAVADEQLHDSIELFTHKSVAGRNAVLDALPEAPGLREQAYRIKQETMAHLDRYLEQMADAVESRGGNVFFAGDGEDVVRYIGDLARSRGAKVITKSKSMATEEIELNRRLEEDYADLDLEIVETDLGEWIAQLAGDTPSHIVGPILHMNRKRITEVLSQTAGEELPPDVEALGSFARKRLREKFLTADIGITGANFGVAETGTIVTVTNEGNARLVTSVPPVHVVVMGIEKLVPRFEDLSVFVRLLARSGTGQKLTVYTNFITGPRQTGELDGAEELHLILMDNGRSKLLGTEFEEALYCIRCGACLNVCPVYRQTGGHAYGSTYSGPIGAVITPLLKGHDEAKDLPHASSLCGACWEACPVGIPLHDLLLKLRNQQVEEGLAGKAQEIAFKGFESTMKRPLLYNISSRAGRLAQKPLEKNDSVRPLPGPLSAWTDSRELPPLAEKSFRELWKGGI